jgi:hypothetical protein
MQGVSQVIMNQTELKMQPTILLERKARYGRGKYPDLRSKCIVGCIFNSVRVIITRESPCIVTRHSGSITKIKSIGNNLHLGFPTLL